MSRYSIEFVARALKQWRALDNSVRLQLQSKLVERQAEPRIPAARVRRVRDGYKIKLRKAGVRLIYTVVEQRLVILVLSVGEREGERAYQDAEREMSKRDD